MLWSVMEMDSHHLLCIGEIDDGVSLRAGMVETDAMGYVVKSVSFDISSRGSQLWEAVRGMDGSIYAVGSDAGFGPGGFYQVPLIMRLDSNLNIIWAKTYAVHNSSNSLTGQAYSISMTMDEDLIISGNHSMTLNEGFDFLAKLDTAGNLIWSKERESGDSFKGSIPVEIELGESDEIYLVEEVIPDGFTSSGGFSIEKLNASGDSIWAYTWETEDNYVSDFKIDQQGNLLVACTWFSTYETGVLVKADSSGNELFQYAYGNDIRQHNVYGLSVSPDNYYGLFGYSLEADSNAFIARVDTLGNGSCIDSTSSYTRKSHESMAWVTGVPLTDLIGLDTVSLSFIQPTIHISSDTNCYTPPPPCLVNAEILSAGNSCVGDSISYINLSSGTSNYAWFINGSFVSNDDDLDYMFFSPGVNEIILVAGTGSCQDTSIIMDTVNAYPNVSFGYVNLLGSYSFTDSSDSGNEWNWTFGDGNASSLQNPTHIYDSTGNYEVCLTVSTNGACPATECDSIFMIITSRPETRINGSITIYPHPVRDIAKIDWEGLSFSPEKIRIHDPMGRLILVEKIDPGQVYAMLDLSLFSTGIYILELRDQGHTERIRVLVE